MKLDNLKKKSKKWRLTLIRIDTNVLYLEGNVAFVKVRSNVTMLIYDGDVIEYRTAGSIHFNVPASSMTAVTADKLYLNYGESGRA